MIDVWEIAGDDWPEWVAAGYIRKQEQPKLPLAILNYTEKAAYEGVWNQATLNCRGLIYTEYGYEVVARPWPKFFNYGQAGAPEADLTEPLVVTDKLDGSLGILYPTPAGYEIATRGSFTSDQAIHATRIWREKYQPIWTPPPGVTALFEIIYPENRVVIDYGGLDDLVFLGGVLIEDGQPVGCRDWPGPRAQEFEFPSFRAALEAPPRDNCEGYVVYFPRLDARLKLKQEDYVALHRILTGTNARHVWEVAAVHACHHLISEPKHWGSYLGIAPGRAAEVLALGDDWLAGVPDEFYAWVDAVIREAEFQVEKTIERADALAHEVTTIAPGRERYEAVMHDVCAKEILRIVDGKPGAQTGLVLRAWREACPEPTHPFARSEAVA